MGKLLAFGEIMLRLGPPGRELLMQTPRLDMWVAGAEANVVTQLACLGHDVGIVSRVPDNDLGRVATTRLRGHGVDTSLVQLGGERMGLYFVSPGAGVRASEVLYDRAGSAFAMAPAGAWNWDAILSGVDRLHLSGITPALGPIPAQSAIAAVEAASARGVAVSFDGNWRGKLWSRWDADPSVVLRKIVEHADLMFGNHRDIALLLNREDLLEQDTGRDRAAAEAAFRAFPKLSMIASTARRIDHGDLHHLSARIDTRGEAVQTDAVVLAGIVDRIGSGDAFAAGVLHAVRTGCPTDHIARIGLMLAALKHSIPGDAGLFSPRDLDAALSGELEVRR